MAPFTLMATLSILLIENPLSSREPGVGSGLIRFASAEEFYTKESKQPIMPSTSSSSSSSSLSSSSSSSSSSLSLPFSPLPETSTSLSESVSRVRSNGLKKTEHSTTSNVAEDGEEAKRRSDGEHGNGSDFIEHDDRMESTRKRLIPNVDKPRAKKTASASKQRRKAKGKRKDNKTKRLRLKLAQEEEKQSRPPIVGQRSEGSHGNQERDNGPSFGFSQNDVFLGDTTEGSADIKHKMHDAIEDPSTHDQYDNAIFTHGTHVESLDHDYDTHLPDFSHGDFAAHPFGGGDFFHMGGIDPDGIVSHGGQGGAAFTHDYSDGEHMWPEIEYGNMDFGHTGIDTHPLHSQPHESLGIGLVDTLNHHYGSPHADGGHIIHDFGALEGMGVDSEMYECYGSCMCSGYKVSCVWRNLTEVPAGISAATKKLHLIKNNLDSLPVDAFENLTRLEELRFVGNNLKSLPAKIFKNNQHLQSLNFQGNLFRKVPGRAFRNLKFLLELYLDANRIDSIPDGAFKGLENLQGLWLSENNLTEVPREAFRELTGLRALLLTKNRIHTIRRYDFANNTKLRDLSLDNNEIRVIEDEAFSSLSNLKHLDLHMNHLHVMPAALSHLTALVQLNLKHNSLSHIPDRSFQFRHLKILEIENNPVRTVDHSAFVNIPNLSELKLSEVYDMVRFPNLTGTTSLKLLRLDRANIRSIPRNFCQHRTKLQQLDLHTNKLRTLPSLSECRSLKTINLAYNELTSIDGQLFQGLDKLQDFTISNNYIQTIAEDTFVGLSSLEYLVLADNHITEIHPNAFLPLRNLKTLNLANNDLRHLPTAGLVSLEKLKVFHNQRLREFPPKEEFPKITSFALSYAYHCCDYISTRADDFGDAVKEYHNFGEDVPHHIWNGHTEFSLASKDNMSMESDIWPPGLNTHELFPLQQHQELPKNYFLTEPGLNGTGDLGAGMLGYPDSDSYDHYMIEKPAIACVPKPGPFMPCDDLFGFWTLRCGVWIVFMLALLGNGVVFFVSVTSKSKMDVTRFLICNLAAADFFMGVYLGMLAIIDASTLGQFKKYAIQWQMSAGCSIAGFLGVLSSELSVFTLTVITLERFYAITHAIQLNKRLSLKHASMIMLGGWIWSFCLALLPIFGVSDYRKFAVCLPFKIEDIISKTYVCFIMMFNGISFFVILSCYLIMYISIRHSQAWNSNDTRVAKRMALLVITDFLCWAPIAFLSLCAAFGKNLVDLTEAKVLTIFVLPLNSCANPFLYAIFTKQFKRDCVLLCRRLEDSSIARHFSQVSPGHMSMSWKCHRRPSGMRMLMGEGKSGTSNNSASHSYGLVNNNSEVSTGTNKDGKPIADHAQVEDKYLHLPKPSNHHHHHHRHHHHGNSKHTSSGLNGTANGGSGSSYRYKPCPTHPGHEESEHGECGHEDKTMGGSVPQDGGGGGGLFRAVRYKPTKSSCRGVKDAQVILHQGYSFQSGAETGGTTTETYLSNDEFDDVNIRITGNNNNLTGGSRDTKQKNSSQSSDPGNGSSNCNGSRHKRLPPSSSSPNKPNGGSLRKSSALKQQEEHSKQQTHQKQQYKRIFEHSQQQQQQQQQQHMHRQQYHYTRLRPPSITLDSGEAGESIEMIFCPSGVYDGPPFPHTSTSADMDEDNPAVNKAGNVADDSNLEKNPTDDDEENDSDCVWVKRSSPQHRSEEDYAGSGHQINPRNVRKENGDSAAGRDRTQEADIKGCQRQGDKSTGQINNTFQDDCSAALADEMPKTQPLAVVHTGSFGSDRSTLEKTSPNTEGDHSKDQSPKLVSEKTLAFENIIGVKDNSIENSMNVSNNNLTRKDKEQSYHPDQLQANGKCCSKKHKDQIISTKLPLHSNHEQHASQGETVGPVNGKVLANSHANHIEEFASNGKQHRDHHHHHNTRSKNDINNTNKHHRHRHHHHHHHNNNNNNNNHQHQSKRTKPKSAPIDKSLHLRFFQDSMVASAEARGEPHRAIYRSNSLVELTESQLRKARTGGGDEQRAAENMGSEINFGLRKGKGENGGPFYNRTSRPGRFRRSLTSKQEESLSSRRGGGSEEETREGRDTWRNLVQDTDGHIPTKSRHSCPSYEEDEDCYRMSAKDMGSTDLDNDSSNSNVSREDPPYRQGDEVYESSAAELYTPGDPSSVIQQENSSSSKPALRNNQLHSFDIKPGKVARGHRNIQDGCGETGDTLEDYSPTSAQMILGWEDSGLAGLNDSDDLRDSLSSTRNSADKESGFHSQA